MKIDFDVLFKHLAKWDKDTFIFGMIAALTIGALTMDAPPIATITAGCLFIVLYIVLRYALLKVQATEREQSLKSLAPRRARRVIDDNANRTEIQKLEKMTDKAKQKRGSE